jgi:Rnl2 family RNA ligase
MFKRYNSIENHYQNKIINQFIERHPELLAEQYVLEDKLDGSNISIIISNDTIRWAKRSCMIANDDNFNGLQSIKHQYDNLINSLNQYRIDNNIEVLQVYGEIYGDGIQKRIKYEPGKHIKFFDIRVDDVMQTPQFLYNLFNELGYEHLLIRVYDIVKGLDNALNFDVNFVNEQGSYIEGVVIKPYDTNFYMPLGSRFILKKKSDKFAEKMKGSDTQQRNNTSFNPEIIRLSKEFNAYINENRILSVFSKEGEISRPNEIAKYIKLVLDDAKEDFLKENTLPEILDKKEEKFIYNVGSEIVKLLKKYL